jgi:hypothetical protein
MKKSFIITSMTAFAALCFNLTAQAQGPVVVSDKDDYAPGENALFQAAGFQPGELLDFSIAISGEDGTWLPDIAWADVPADASGGAEVDYIVPQTWANKTLQLTVMGLTSGLMATTTFTDAAAANVNFAASGLPAGTSVTVNVDYTNNGGNNIVGTYNFSSPGPGADIGTLAHSSFTYTFPATIVVGTDTYDLISSSPTSPFTTGDGAPAPATTVTGTYQLHVVTPTNQPPVVTPVSEVHVDLGQIVGCLDGNGGFGTSVEVDYSVTQVDANNFNVYATFDGNNQTLIGTVNDPDGNLQLANIVPSPGSQTLTFTGPGSDTQSFSTSVTATDDANDSDTETCPTIGDATVQVVYNFSGFFPPLSGQTNCKVKQGSGIPVKFSITDCSGNPITTGDQTIEVVFHCGIGPNGDPEVDDAGMSGDNGINFRYDSTGMQWIFNLKTNSSYVVGNTYKIIAHLDDGTDHEVFINIKR